MTARRKAMRSPRDTNAEIFKTEGHSSRKLEIGCASSWRL